MKYDAKDVTFIIPVKYDHPDREENLYLTLSFITHHFDTNIIIGEQGSDWFNWTDKFKILYTKFDYDCFHRTKMLNEMTKIATTPIIVNWDADVLCETNQLQKSFELIRNKEYDFVYPYDGRFARVDRVQWYRKLLKLKLTILKNQQFKGTLPGDKLSVGGAVVFDKNSFIRAGMENENFISHAPEDVERFWRFNMLGYFVGRVDGIIYHLDHYCGEDSGHKNDYQILNRSEWRRVKEMNPEELRQYISTWDWVPKIKL